MSAPAKFPDHPERLSLAYKLAEQGSATVGSDLLLRACAVQLRGVHGPDAAAVRLRALADELEAGR